MPQDSTTVSSIASDPFTLVKFIAALECPQDEIEQQDKN